MWLMCFIVAGEIQFVSGKIANWCSFTSLKCLRPLDVTLLMYASIYFMLYFSTKLCIVCSLYITNLNDTIYWELLTIVNNPKWIIVSEGKKDAILPKLRAQSYQSTTARHAIFFRHHAIYDRSFPKPSRFPFSSATLPNA